jgi:hypothetical protein
MSITPQQAEFAARLARIEADGGRKATIFVGLDESFVLDRSQKKQRRAPVAGMLVNALYPLSMVLSFGMGGVAYAIGRYIRFHLSGVSDAPVDPDIEMLIDMAAGLVIGLLLSQIDRMKLPEQKVAKAFGVIFGMLTFHNFVHLYPEPFTKLFSELWVTRLISSTEAHSLLWRGISFTF